MDTQNIDNNTIYICHMRSKLLASRVIELGSYLNSWKSLNYSHTALIYTNSKGKRMIVEADPFKGVYEMEYQQYLIDGKNMEIQTAYTPLHGLITEQNTIEHFEKFLEKDFLDHSYSIRKCLKSFEFEPLSVKSLWELIEEAKEHEGNFFTKFTNFVGSAAQSVGNAVANWFRWGTNLIGQTSCSRSS